MGTRRLTAAEEAALIADAEQARESDEELPAAIPARRAGEGSVVLSVRIPASQMARLKHVARERNQSLSSLVQDALMALESAPGPSIMSGRPRSLAVAVDRLSTSRTTSHAASPDTSEASS